jgi:hypothetical protein
MGNPILLAIVVILVVFAAVILISGLVGIPGLTLTFGSLVGDVVAAIVVLIIAAMVYWFAARV